MRQAASDNNENRKKQRWQLATAADLRGRGAAPIEGVVQIPEPRVSES